MIQRYGIISGVPMNSSPDDFNMQETVQAVLDALGGVFCHVCFDASLYGIPVAAAVALLSLVVKQKKQHMAKPMLLAAGKLAVVCAIFSIPGFICLAITGSLPSTGYFQVNGIGFIGFWSLVSVWQCGEQVNHQWFSDSGDRKITRRVETSNDQSTSKIL